MTINQNHGRLKKIVDQNEPQTSAVIALEVKLFSFSERMDRQDFPMLASKTFHIPTEKLPGKYIFIDYMPALMDIGILKILMKTVLLYPKEINMIKCLLNTT